MSNRRPDKTLRRMVADLAMASPEDAKAILDELDARARQRVEALLAEYRGEVAPLSRAAPVNAIAQPIAIDGLSPWLAARLDRRTQTTAGRPGSLTSAAEARELGVDYSITQTAFEALRSVAAATREAAKERTPAPWSGPARKALLGRRAAR
ncbi:MAG: hypothetical protein ACM3YN_07930 [Parcubacteria group bacterium]